MSKGTLIALAWPDTKVVKEGKWYDVPMQWLGVVKDGKYNAGHAALLLVEHGNGEVHYFDYGRYHTPIKYGRVRDKHTDPDVEIRTKAILEEGQIKNLGLILREVADMEATHGVGRMIASVTKEIDFSKAYGKAKAMQDREAIKYGPFEIGGSTCARLVTQVASASCSNVFTWLRLKVPYTVSPTPRSNLKILNDLSYYYQVKEGELSLHKNRFYIFRRMFFRKAHRDAWVKVVKA